MHLKKYSAKKMKNSIRDISAEFSTARMVAEYSERFYLPGALRWHSFMADNMSRARELADWKESINDRWGEVSVGKIDVISKKELLVGGQLQVRCQVKLGSIDPSDVRVELYQGPVDAEGTIQQGDAVSMECVGAASDNYHVFDGFIPCRVSGLCGFAVRVIPHNPDLANKYDTGLIRWEEPIEEKAPQKEAASPPG